MFYFKVAFLMILQISVMYSQDCKTPEECYNKAIDKMNAELAIEKKEVQDFIKGEQEYINKQSEKIQVIQNEVQTKAQKVAEKALEVEAKAKSLDQIRADIEAKHAEVEKKYQEFANSINAIDDMGTGDRFIKENFMYREAIIHQDILDAFDKGIVKKIGAPSYFNDGSYRGSSLWNKRHILNIGNRQEQPGNGIEVKVPIGYDVIWLRCLNDRWETFTVRGGNINFGTYACGYRQLNEISPDGGSADSFDTIHMWISVAVRKDISIYQITNGPNSDGWLSGIAFGKNMWNHAYNSAVAYHWALNGGHNLEWDNHNWNSDQLARIVQGAVRKLIVPVVPNGKPKLLYFVEHNNNWVGTMHTGVKVNGKIIERFRTTYRNPFATRFNSKIYDRYIAAFVPSEYIPQGAVSIEVDIDMSLQDHNIYFREMGTHDFE